MLTCNALLFVFSAIALISKYVTKGWKEVQVAHENKENAEEVIRVLSYLEVVEKVKHSRDETEVVTLIEEHKLEREQLLTEHLKFKQASLVNHFFFSRCFLFFVLACFIIKHFHSFYAP